MKNIILAKTNYDALYFLIQKLKSNDFRCGRHVFIVPDRMSVLCEKTVFEKLHIESTCNIEVMTLSRIAMKLIKNKNVITKSASCMILQKVLNDKKDELKCFNKVKSSEVAESIFGTISQFKSCKIEPDSVKIKLDNPILEDKLNDISLLYKGYTEELRNRNLIDSLDKLNFLESAISSSSYIQNSYFYVCFFDGFTFQGYDIISNIVKNALEFNIGIAFSSGLNEHIYNKKYLEKVANVLGEANVINCPESQKDEQFKFILDNLFTFSPGVQKVEEGAGNIEFFEGENLKEEITNVCMQIRDMVLHKNYKLSDFNIALPELASKKSALENVLKDFDFNYFFDVSIAFKDTILPSFLNALFDLVIENYSKKSVLKFLKHPLITINEDELCEFEDYVTKFDILDIYDLKNVNITQSELFSSFDLVRNNLFSMTEEFVRDINNAKTYGDFVSATKKLLEKLEISKKLDALTADFINSNNLEQMRLYEGYMNELNEILDLISSLLKDDECELKDYMSTLQTLFNEKKISTSPLSIDAIFVGDSSVSFFEKRKVMFVIDMNEEEFPKKVSDCGLITDDDIELLSDKYLLEPSIFEINKKERYKAFELLLIPTEKLYLSYNFEKSVRSKIYDDVLNLFVVENEGKFFKSKIKTMKSTPFFVKNNTLSLAKQNLTKNLREIYDGQKKKDESLDTLYFAVKDSLSSDYISRFNFANEIELNENVFFTKNKTSISEIETYMTCPFLHFARYGLRLQEKNKGEVDRASIGNIMHRLAYIILKNYSLPLNDNEVVDVTKKTFDKILEEENFKSLMCNLQNKIILKNLKEEGIRFVRALNNQAKYSLFKPKYFEARFDDKGGGLSSLKIDSSLGKISLVGQIDRIDTFKNYFRVIDYKTGKTDSSLKELFFGKKIQLETYLKVVSSSLNLRGAGSYYLPIKGNFYDLTKDGEQNKYALQGRTLQDGEVVNASDTRFECEATKSDIIDLKLKKNEGGIKEYNSLSHTFSKEEIEAMSSYAVNLVKEAITDILSFNVTPKPLNIGTLPCESCKFFKLCRFDENFKNEMRSPRKKIDMSIFLGEEEDK